MKVHARFSSRPGAWRPRSPRPKPPRVRDREAERRRTARAPRYRPESPLGHTGAGLGYEESRWWRNLKHGSKRQNPPRLLGFGSSILHAASWLASPRGGASTLAGYIRGGPLGIRGVRAEVVTRPLTALGRTFVLGLQSLSRILSAAVVASVPSRRTARQRFAAVWRLVTAAGYFLGWELRSGRISSTLWRACSYASRHSPRSASIEA